MTLVAPAQIADLEDLLTRLPADARAAATRLYLVTSTVGRLEQPPEMEQWIVKLFGSVEAVREQRIVRVTDLVTLQGALFNELRARRPMEVKGADEMRRTIDDAVGDPFCHVETGTPADTFGRIQGERGRTASNIAKYDGYHGVLVFDAHDPLVEIGEDQLRDHLATARRWAEAALEADPGARYYFLMWNSTWRAGGSIIHAHMQMTTTRGMHYPKVEALRRQALAYRARYERDYFDDLWAVHEALGLGIAAGRARVLASLTPVKEREVLVLGRPGDDESSLAGGIARTLAAHRSLGVVAFNMALYLPPLAPDGDDWQRFPPHARVVDRGDPGNRTSDIGAMELYAASVIASDPFRVADALRA
ncbi:MAG: hypothetical protein A2082_02460 [Chloroflexi bacterium GWC2_70_10]|nr:MAG: hypothetical protein A2082_02460 [Chloroflexi bacterium GWC2_70_10]